MITLMGSNVNDERTKEIENKSYDADSDSVRKFSFFCSFPYSQTLKSSSINIYTYAVVTCYTQQNIIFKLASLYSVEIPFGVIAQ